MKQHLVAICFVLGSVSNFEINKLHEVEGDLKIAFLVDDCTSLTHDTSLTRTLVNSAIWTTERINLLEITAPLTVGLDVFKVCTEVDFYGAIFAMFRQQQEHGYLLGIVSNVPVTPKVREFCEVLDLRSANVVKFWTHLIKATVKLLGVLNWKDNVTVMVEDPRALAEFYMLTRKEWICVKTVIAIENPNLLSDQINSPIVIFGNSDAMNSILNVIQKLDRDALKIIFAPLDGSTIEDLPEGSYIVRPIHADLFQKYTKSPKIIPSPLLFDIASPFIDFTRNVSHFVAENCSQTTYKMNCFRNNYKKPYEHQVYSYSHMLNLLKIKPLASKFNYEVYHVENLTALKMDNATREFDQFRTNVFQTLAKVFTYNVFDDVLADMEQTNVVDNYTSFGCNKMSSKCANECINFQLPRKRNVSSPYAIFPRSESWVFAFASVSTLGVVFCVAIIIFIIIRMWRQQIFEGNPTLTIMLLFIALAMYCCVVPFSFDGDASIQPLIHMARSVAVTIPYAGAFSLLLSRSILLATVSKEIGFMSHVAGTVQSFLCLFIFGVQCALSVQIVRHCQDDFYDFMIVYMLSYNIILLALLVCLCPLIAKSQRNYREGRYFTIAIVLIACTWCCWLPSYAILSHKWKDPMLCFGLVSTASILLGALFIPRTYLMTVAAARDRFASALPSLATATSTMDMYRTSTQPLYDCVNVATVNALNIRNGASHITAPGDLYSSVDLDAKDEIEIHSCDTPTNPDKVTRF